MAIDFHTSVGDQIDALTWRPTAIQLFRFSAATWNAHRIHYDAEYARTEGYPGVLVQSHLHACFLAKTLLAWAGPGAVLSRLRWENRRLAVVGDVLTCTGTVTEIGPGVVSCELKETNQDDALCAPAWATIQIGLANGP